MGILPVTKFCPHCMKCFQDWPTFLLFDNGWSDPALNIHERKCRSVWSLKTIKRSGATEVLAFVLDYALWLFSKWSSQTDSLRHWYYNDNETKVTLVKINRGENKMSMIKGRWHLNFCFPLLKKQSDAVISFSFSSLQCALIADSKSIFIAYIGVVL